jgi:hypothetical protein
MTTLAITPASGSITATKTVCRVQVTDAPDNTFTGYVGTLANTPTGQTQYPSAPAEVYYIDFVKGGTVQGRSYRFSPSPGPTGGGPSPAVAGSHTFNNYIFPSAGSWTVNLIRVRDGGTEATLAVTVA